MDATEALQRPVRGPPPRPEAEGGTRAGQITSSSWASGRAPTETGSPGISPGVSPGRVRVRRMLISTTSWARNSSRAQSSATRRRAIAAGQAQQVVAAPQEPGEQAGHLEPEDLADALEPAERDQHALLAVVERRRAAGRPGRPGCSAPRAAPRGRRAGRWPASAGRSRVEDRGAVAERPDAFEARDREGGIGPEPAPARRGGRQAREDRMWGVADRADDGRGRDLLPSSSSTRSGSTRRAAVRARVGRRPAPASRRVAAQAFAELVQHECAAVDKDDLGRGSVGEGPAGGVQQVVSSAATSTPVDPPPTTTNVSSALALRVGLGARLLEHRQGTVAEVERVAQAPEPDRVLGHAGHGAEVGDAAERQDERVVGDGERPRRRRRRTGRPAPSVSIASMWPTSTSRPGASAAAGTTTWVVSIVPEMMSASSGWNTK